MVLPDFIKQRNLRDVEETVLVSDACSIKNGAAANLSLSDNSFFPIWGEPRVASQTDEIEREIPIIFVGNLGEIEPYEASRSRISGRDPVFEKIFDTVVERMIDDTGTLDAFSIAREETINYEREHYAGMIFGAVDRMLRQKRRKKMIQNFQRLPIMIFGQVTDPEILAQENITCVGPTPLSEVVENARKAKILLGDFANFVSGVELRPSIAFANGCVLAGEANSYFRENFPDSSFINTLTEGRHIETRVSDLISKKDQMEEMDRQAGDIYNKLRTVAPRFIH